jgi:hypothetical protein
MSKAGRKRSTSDARSSPGPYAAWVNEHARQPLPDDPDAVLGDTIIDGVHHVITVSGHLRRVEPRVMELVEDMGRLALREKQPADPPPPEPETGDRPRAANLPAAPASNGVGEWTRWIRAAANQHRAEGWSDTTIIEALIPSVEPLYSGDDPAVRRQKVRGRIRASLRENVEEMSKQRRR